MEGVCGRTGEGCIWICRYAENANFREKARIQENRYLPGAVHDLFIISERPEITEIPFFPVVLSFHWVTADTPYFHGISAIYFLLKTFPKVLFKAP
jgi:hypothetical protein